ncbi:hypothetical protein E7T09_04245 [Deinococcus sp. KSM4-11]|uniref:hypothetical protein n=1 Tax=Deinococcus sp. KSM4-11 TaxID=2568654 RepID=UPI0010A5438F|nr:hypothetical protein [Deinococcus sp. KSM4-11]THF88424.1 hypothetical protein E7T09_04245 [Deinococcus sp. KSM4-11]
MTPVIYPVSSTTLPRAGVIEVPCYRAQSFNGRTAVMASEDKVVEFDFETMTEQDMELATAERLGEYTIQGLIAVDVDWLIQVMEATAANGKTLGAELEEVWHYLSPMNMAPSVVAGQYVVVGLYR